MAFACIYIPDFMVQSLMRSEPALRDGPLAVIEGAPPLWNVVAANPVALRAGLKLGMTKAQAEEFGIPVRHRSESQEKATHAALLDAGWGASPRVEETREDTIVLDIAGLDSLFGSRNDIARELARRASHLGLIPQVAAASSIEAAIHAARGFAGITVIPDGEERKALSGLPIHVLSAGVETIEVLERWGVETLGGLANLPVLPLSERLGAEGVRLHQIASGSCTRSIVLASPSLHFEEEMELEDAVEELDPLSFLLGRLLDQLCARLAGRALALRALHLQFDLEPHFEREFRSLADDVRPREATVYGKVLTLPVPVRDAKLLLQLLRLQLQSDPPLASIRKISLSAEASAPRVTQNGLFAPQAPDPEKLELTLARLAKLVGQANAGSPEPLDTHRPGAFRMNRFAPSQVRPEKSAQNASGKIGTAKPMQGFRAIRPPVPITVDIRDEEPVRVYLRGKCGTVTAASGPWKTSGDWWQDSWQHSEWDVALDFGTRTALRGSEPRPDQGVYRIYNDGRQGRWFVRGTHD
ncbi:MAG TPA: hypothetical protein VN661_02155 [Candidatus Acidoferrales bacterium]|nr:hypothetical protein [Candidatus Acidoferrales bacterium]